MRKIKTVTDKSGEALELWHSDSIAFTPALAPFLKVYAEIIEKSFTLPVMAFKNSNRVVWAEDKDKVVVGGICYEYLAESKTGWLVLSFTDPMYRGRGINSLCHEIYEKDCIALGANNLSSVVDIDNESRIKSAAKVGMVPRFYRMYKKL
jgi:hypothetical protein